MADQAFKRALAVAYARAYPKLTLDYGRGVGIHEVSFFALSVQFLNRHAIVSEIVTEHAFFPAAVASLSLMLEPAAHDLPNIANDICCQYRRYNPILADLRVIFSISGVSRRFIAECLEALLELYSKFQLMNPQVCLARIC